MAIDAASEVDAWSSLSEVGGDTASERVEAVGDAVLGKQERQQVGEGTELSRGDELVVGEAMVRVAGAELVEETHRGLCGIGYGHGMTVEPDGIEPSISMTAQGPAVNEGDIDDVYVVVANAEVLAPAYRIEELVGGAVVVDDKDRERKRKSRRLRPLHGRLKCASSGKDDLSFVAGIVVGWVENFERVDVKHVVTCFVAIGQ